VSVWLETVTRGRLSCPTSTQTPTLPSRAENGGDETEAETENRSSGTRRRSLSTTMNGSHESTPPALAHIDRTGSGLDWTGLVIGAARAGQYNRVLADCVKLN